MDEQNKSLLMEEELDEKKQQELLEKYDAEARTRTYESKGMSLFVSILAISISLYHLYTALFWNVSNT